MIEDLVENSDILRKGFRLFSWVLSLPKKEVEKLVYQSPEKTTTQFANEAGLKTRKVSFGWHVLLRQEMYNRQKRPGFRVDKRLKKLAFLVFRTDNTALI